MGAAERPPLDSLPPWPNPKHPSFEFRPVDRERRLPGHFWIKCTDELPDDPLTHAAYRDESACSSHVVTSVPG